MSNFQENKSPKLTDRGKILIGYEQRLYYIWSRSLPTLGQVAVSTIITRALEITSQNYPFISHLKVTSAGISFQELRQKLSIEQIKLLQNGLEALEANTLDLLETLTGDILTQQILAEIEQIKAGSTEH